MNYSGNMPDWHQYNPSQSGINDVTSTAQNVNSGHLSFISSISPTCPTQLSSLNLSSEGFEKHQSDPNFNPRHFQPHLASNISHGHNAAADNTPLASMVQMQNCISHYGPSNTRNPMVDNPMDPRNASIGGLNEELGYRNNQVPLNGPISHMNGPNVMNMNAPPHGSIGPRNTNVNSHAANRTAGPPGPPPPSYVPCKGLCCNPDPNIGYQQWEKYCYQNNATYRENIRSSAGYQADARRFNNDFNFRKDNFDGKEVLSSVVPPSNGPNADHRRNFSDFKYRKDRLLSRNYPPSSAMLQNYPMQNYNYTGEYQKYPYNVKEYPKMSGMNVPNQGMVKHQEQGFVIPQQKYNSKQVPYQNNGGAMMPSNIPSATNVPNPNMIPPAQNTYFNSQYPRNIPTENTHDCQETATDVSMINRMQASTMHAVPHHRYQIYQQKVAMQRFSMENHLKEFSRIPGYQSHPKYKECMQKYREILKCQQNVTYQGPIQQTPPCATASTVTNTSTIPPINLQFDQNGVLINSNYMPEAFSRIQQVPPVNPQAPLDNSANKQAGKQDSVPEMANHNVQKPERLISQQHNNGDGLAATVLCSENVQKQDGYPAQKSLDHSQFEIQKTGSENFNNLGTNAGNTTIRQKMSKEFADKPELDVRQFLANWDESEDEDGASNNLPSAILSESTPVVIVGYENVNLSAKTLEDLNGSKSEEIASNVITFENQNKNSNIDVVPAQDCLTISYSAAQNLEMAKDSTCKEIISKENIVRPGSHIIQCIRNGPDEVPTIHIVDNLEIGSILQVANGQTVAETLERQEAVSFFQEGTEVTASAITLAIDKKTDNESASTEYNAETLETLSKDIVEGSSPPKTVEDTSQTRVNDSEILPISIKDNNLDVQNLNLKKQNSFASEESHNPDDISLPDLPTSECTPISTTLNTPIHSDNEESSESHADNLTIPTNPIEVIQNSPMLSFTQSPTNREPYDHLSDERNKPIDSSEGEYRAENHFKNDASNNMLNHDTVLGTFEFSNIDKNDSTKNEKERASINENSKNNNEKASSPHDETENAETASMRMTLTSAGEYELKIVSTGTQQTKPTRDYQNSTITEHRANESQVTSSAGAHKQLQILPEPNVKTTLRYANSMELNNIALQNITNDPDPVELDGQDVNYSEKKCMLTCQTITGTISLLPTNDIASKNSRPAVEDDCSTKTVKNNSMSQSTKHSSLSSDKSKKCETGDKFAKEDSFLERNVNGNKAAKIDAKDSKNSRHGSTLMDHKKSISDNQTTSRKKTFSSENTDKLCSETIIHHNKHTQEAATLKDKSCPVESFKEPDISRNKPRIIDNVNIDDSGERMRLLKEYRKMKYKTPTVGLQNKNEGTQEDSEANKKLNSSLNSEEMLQSSNRELYQKDIARLKSSEEKAQEKKHASILKTFVTKNINPDFAIQVTNVNLKRKDSDQKESQHLEEETKSSGPLDAIKIEINVSCTERNTTEKLLHENIKNAVAETIGHLTNSISNGVRSNSTNITEIQCDKKTVCDKAADCHDYERRNRSPAALTETSTYTEICEDPINTEVVKHDAVSTTYKEDSTNDEISGSLKKRRSSLVEGELIDDLYENKGNINIETESKSEQTVIRRRSLHEESDRKVIAINSYIEELKTSSDHSPCVGSTSRNVSVQKEHQENTAASLCRNTKNFQDDITSRLNAIPSTSSNTMDSSLENASYNNSLHFDYNHFDVAPNENADANAKRIDKWKRSKKDDGRFNNFDLYKNASGYVNPTFSNADELENLNIVPVYTTKDGKITYSPNPRFTYRELIMEARANESYDNTRESYLARSPMYDYYNCSKMRKIFKRNRDVASSRKAREGEISSARHIDHLSNKNAYKSNPCAKTSRNISHLEFFNDDADKLYTNRSSQQESKENNRKNILDLSFLEKQYNLDNEAASSTKYCKTKASTDNLAYEKGHSESSVLDSNLFLPPKPPCWEETMESIKSYSSHVDRRNSDSAKELNFSEIFAAQKRLDSFLFLSTDQDSSDNSNRKAVSTTTNETIMHRLTCDFTEDLDSIRNNDSQCEQLDIAPHNKEENECNNQNDTLARGINNESANIFNISLNMQRNDEYAKKQECQSDEIKSSDLLIEQSSPKVIDEKIHKEPEKNQCSMNNVKNMETLTKSQLKEDDIQVYCTPASPKEDKSNENANEKQVSSENCIEVASPFKLNAESKNILDESKCTDTVKDFAPTLNKQDEINDSLKDNLESVVSQEILYQQDSSALIDRKDSEKVAPAIESNISTEIDFNQSNKQDDAENSKVCKLNEPIIVQNSSDVIPIEQLHNELGNEQQKLENDRERTEVLSKDQENDEVDHCNTAITSTPAVALDLSAGENVCDLFANEKHKQNISEFTVIKSIINSDEKQLKSQESGTKENLGDCDISLDSKLLCIDSSDCGIYAEDRCPLTQMSEHDFTEEDSIVPMEWETSQIQEDAVNRLCNIGESSMDFMGAARSLQETNSLLDNLSLSRTSVIKESRVSEAIDEITSKPNDESDMSAIESTPIIEESKTTPTSNDENKEQDQVSSSDYEKMTYLRATDCNANTKIVPKLVIKKSEASSKFVTKMSSSSVIQMDNNIINKSIFRPGCQPKIPKMIIRNARSRPGTPSIEAVHEETPPVQANTLDRILFTNEELYMNDSEDSLQDSSNYRNKIPKMKIKLDEKNSNKIVRSEDTEVCIKRKSVKKTVPKVKIKNPSKNDLSDNSVCNNTISQELKDSGRYEEKIPILKLRKQERNRSPSPEVTRKRQSSCHPEVPLKKYKKLGRDEIGHSTRRSNSSDSMRTIAPDHETKKNPLIRISEKIPKVIIKRTSASAEFKCELSKGCKNVIAKSAKWQPEVKLERYRILDSMVKDLKLSLSPISMRTIDEIFSNRKHGYHREKKDDHKLSRSNSTSDLLPVKCKQRRMSDYDCRKINDTLSYASTQDTDSRTKTCTTPKKNRGSKSTDEFQKDNKRSRSRDNNSRREIDVTLSEKEGNRLFEKSSTEKATLHCDEHKSDSFVIDREQVVKANEDTIFSNKDKKNSIKQSNDSTDFKLALEELKTTSKIESFVKVSDVNESLSEEVNLRTNEEQKERDDDDDIFLDKDDCNKIVIKKERLSSSDDIDNNCTLQDDIGSLKDDTASMLDNFEMDKNSVIKIESSDESQSTIEILPASPNGTSELENNMMEDCDNEQLYSADAIPTQFELELEITDNSNTDLLDVFMPKLDPISGYCSRRTSNEESCGDKTLKITRCNKFETSFHSKSLLAKDKHVMKTDISSDDKSVLEDKLVGFIKEISSKSSCDKAVASTVTRDNFCCNDSLIKEVLAAKETLKKCLSKSKCESQNNARPKTAAEKKQGSSFDLNSLSETTHSSDASSQGCNDIISQKDSTPAASNKTENIPNAEKSDKKHSKQNKNSFIKRKMKSPEKNDKADTKETIENMRECTTISLKASKRLGEAMSNESLIRTIYLSEKRKKNLTEQSDSVQLQDSQRREENKLASFKIPKISKSLDQESDTNGNTKKIKPTKEDNMPILEPEVTVNFDANSDRDNSRSPPVITIQDNEDLDISESKLLDDKVIMSSDKIEDDTKDVKKSEISVADFITQLAYHEKATIKHRRYCNLCERWFPTTSRHRRHLAGYQHRHIELTQRRSIHALFMLFTGKPCPRLLPANVARNDCSVGELTPLQIAVQDVTNNFNCTQQSPRKQNDIDK